MYTINANSKYELIIKNSKFITLLYKVNSLNLIKDILFDIKNKYPDATHYCYAYILDNYKKSSDDGEPSGTAGLPILKVLENNNLNYILAIVIRYFGGTLLGANGLIRAYSKSIANAVKENTLKELVDGLNIDITFNFSNLKRVDYLLKDKIINNKIYNNNITYNLDIPTSFLDVIIKNNIPYQIKANIYIEK